MKEGEGPWEGMGRGGGSEGERKWRGEWGNSWRPAISETCRLPLLTLQLPSPGSRPKNSNRSCRFAAHGIWNSLPLELRSFSSDNVCFDFSSSISPLALSKTSFLSKLKTFCLVNLFLHRLFG